MVTEKNVTRYSRSDSNGNCK